MATDWYDLREDFVDIRDVLVKETLTEEEVQEGLEPEEVLLKVALTIHSEKRMSDTYGRECEWEKVANLIEDKGTSLLQVKNGEEFVLLNEQQTLALICQMHFQDGMWILILITVIRKVFVSNNNEHEKRVFIDRKKNIVL